MKILRGAYHFFLAWFGNIIFGFPSRHIIVIGVTGTKGKSTTVELISAVLKSGGFTTAVLGTVRKKIAGESVKNRGNTMPGRFAIQRFLRDAVRAGCTHAIIEVSSQGVVQHRHRFIHWDAGVFLNLAPEHIESHGSFEAYRSAKVKFFRDATRSKKSKKYFFINARDSEKGAFLAAVNGVSGCRAIEFDAGVFTTNVMLRNTWVSTDFNLENSAAAIAVGEIFGVPADVSIRALAEFPGVPGRMELVQKNPFTVVIDYAHTPDSLKLVYGAVRRVTSAPSKMICVLGAAAGGRDVWKRSVMGTIAYESCDEIILTNEDPFDENPEKIIADIERGFQSSHITKPPKIEKILDRRSAIHTAIAHALPGDAVVITGKGSESTIRVAHGKSIPWNERTETESAIALLHK